MRKLPLTLSALVLSGTIATAQVNTVPQVGTISAVQKQYSYSASAIALVPAASATDIFCISPGTSRNIAIKRIEISGTAGTAITTPFLVYRRASLDTGGTAATGLALPVAGKLNPADPASSATLTAYTANPTIVDSSPVLLDSILPTLAVTTTANNGIVAGDYGESMAWFIHSLILQKGTTQQICINLNAVSVSSGVVNINMFWTEQ
jgi:hypothetical protein